MSQCNGKGVQAYGCTGVQERDGEARERHVQGRQGLEGREGKAKRSEGRTGWEETLGRRGVLRCSFCEVCFGPCVKQGAVGRCELAECRVRVCVDRCRCVWLVTSGLCQWG